MMRRRVSPSCRRSEPLAVIRPRTLLVPLALLVSLIGVPGTTTAQVFQTPPPPPPPIEQTTEQTTGAGEHPATPPSTGGSHASPSSATEAPPSPEVLRATARVIAEWNSGNIGELFIAIKKIAPKKGAIDTIRELNKAIKENKSPLGAAEAAAIGRKLTGAQIEIKRRIIAVREDAFAAFARKNHEAARTFSAIGDVGSWPGSDDINSDVDWTVFGTDPQATKLFVESYYDPMLLKALAGDGSGLDLRADFDIVVTPEGWEKQAGVFESAGGKALAKTVMSRVIPINADGSLGTVTSTDVAAELENTKVQARLRELATERGVYEKVFDAQGHFKAIGAFAQKQHPTQDQIDAGWVRADADPALARDVDEFLEAADDEGLLRYDSKIVRRETLAGTCLDMLQHLHHEAIEKLGTLDKKGQIKRIMKYPGRSDWAYGKSTIPDRLIEDYVVMGDDRIRKLLKLSADFHAAKEKKAVTPRKAASEGGEGTEKPADTKPINEELARMVSLIADAYPDSHELGRLAETMIVRQSHLAMQIQLDEIAKSPDVETRARRLKALIDDFGLIDAKSPFRAYAQAQVKALGEFKKISDDPAAFEKLRKTHQSLEVLSDPQASRTGERLRGFLKQTELGGRLLDIHERATALADRVKKTSERITWPMGEVSVAIETAGDHFRETSELFRLVEGAKQDLDRIAEVGSMPTADLLSVLDRVGTAVDLLQAVGDAKTDADLAYNLGKALWDNTGVGGVVNSLYAFTVGGDNLAMAKFMMFALCPSAAIPELVGKIGNFTMRTGAQKLFDMQLDALYAASRFAGDPGFVEKPEWKSRDAWILADFVGYGSGAPAVDAFLDDLLTPGGYRNAEAMIVTRVDNLLGQLGSGGGVFMKAAVVKAIWATLMLGDPLVLGDDADLATAAQRVKLITDDIVLLSRQLGKEVARAPEFFVLPDGLSKGEQAALNKLVAEREVWVGKAKKAMAAAIVRTFEERRRADANLSDREIERRMAELRALLTKLEVLEPALYNLGEEGSYNFLQRNTPVLGRSTQDQQRKLMTAINRYFDAYSQVLSLRDALTQIIAVRTGNLPARPVLTGAPPLCGERGIDNAAALALFEKVRSGGEATAAMLAGIKGAPLGGAFDERIRRGVDAASIAMAQAETDGDIARSCRELHWKAEVIDRARFTEAAGASTERYAAAQQQRQVLIDEFTAFYAALKRLPAEIVLDPAAPVQGQTVTARIDVGAATLPEGATWVWSLDDAGVRVGSWRGATIRFAPPFRGTYWLEAALTVSGNAIKTVGIELRVEPKPGLAVAVVPTDPAPDAAMTAQARLEPPNLPPGATWEWRCENCTITAARDGRAELKAPAKGSGLIRVDLLAGPADKRVTIAEASAPFRVDEAEKPQDQAKNDGQPPPVPPNTLLDGNKPPTDDKPPKNDGKDGKPPPDPKVKPPVAAILPVPDLSSWLMAVSGREELVQFMARPNLTPADRDAAKASMARAEAQMKVFWDAAAAETAVAEDYAGRMRAEVDKVYATWLTKAGGRLADEGGNITDLEGETVASRRNSCISGLENNRTRDLAVIDEELGRIRAIRARFKAFSPERAAYFEAMNGYEALTVDHDSTRWKTKGFERTILDPCDGPSVKVSLPAANVAATPTPPKDQPPTEPPPTVELVLDPASKGRPEATVVARVKDGKPPFAFAWAGAKSSAGERAVYLRPVGKGPQVEAEVRVADAAGRTATASLPIDPVGLTVKLTKLTPSGKELPVGATASFRVALSSDGTAVDPKGWVLRWQTTTDGKFAKAEGPGVTENSVAWSRTGKAPVWVIALQRRGAALATVAESEQIELEVTASGITIDAVPPDPLVGQEVRLTAKATPPMAEDAATWWWEATGDMLHAGPTADPRVYTFVPKTTRPATLTAHLKERLHGEELAKAAATVTARLYGVSVVTLGPAFENSTTKPVVWRQGKGLVTLERELLPDMDVGFRADITPTPVTPQLRYRWTVGDGASLTGNPASRETRAKRPDAGPITVTVEVRNAEDIVLGSAGATVNVAVSAADLATGRQKAAELDKAKKDAERAWAEGDLDAACRAAQAAAAIDPNVTQAKTHCAARDRVAGLAREAEAAIAEKTPAGLERAKRKIDEIRTVNAKAGVIADLEKKLAGTAPDKSADRKKRMDLLLEGAAACNKADWKTCRTKLVAALDRAETVFGPDDAGTLTKARALLDKADREIAAAAKRDDERKRRMDEILAGAKLCGQSQWKPCRDRLAAALAGGDAVFTPEDAGRLAKARELLAKADRMLAAPTAPPDGKPPETTKPSKPSEPKTPPQEPGATLAPATPPAPTEPSTPPKKDPVKPDATPSSPPSSGATTGAAPSPTGGVWVLRAVTYHKRDEFCAVGGDCLTGQTWVDQGTEHRIGSASPTAFVFGRKVASGQPAPSSIRVRWEEMPKRLIPGQPFRLRFAVDVLTPGHGNSDTQAWVYRGPGAGGGQRNLGWLTTRDAGKGGNAESEPEPVPAGPAAGTADPGLVYKVGASAVAQIDFVYRWDATGAATAAPPPAQPPAPPPKPPGSAASGLDGVYVGAAKTTEGRAAGAKYTWTIAGGRVELRSDRGAVAVGRVAPDGTFAIDAGTTTVRGRITGDTLSGTYAKTDGEDDAETGTFEARREPAR